MRRKFGVVVIKGRGDFVKINISLEIKVDSLFLYFTILLSCVSNKNELEHMNYNGQIEKYKLCSSSKQ